jgi:hypothetical protein
MGPSVIQPEGHPCDGVEGIGPDRRDAEVRGARGPGFDGHMGRVDTHLVQHHDRAGQRVVVTIQLDPQAQADTGWPCRVYKSGFHPCPDPPIASLRTARSSAAIRSRVRHRRPPPGSGNHRRLPGCTAVAPRSGAPGPGGTRASPGTGPARAGQSAERGNWPGTPKDRQPSPGVMQLGVVHPGAFRDPEGQVRDPRNRPRSSVGTVPRPPPRIPPCCPVSPHPWPPV